MPAAARRRVILIAAGTLALGTLAAGGLLWEELWQRWWVMRLGATDPTTRGAAAAALRQCASRLRPSVVPLLARAIESVPGRRTSAAPSRPAVVPAPVGAALARSHQRMALGSDGPLTSALLLELIVDHVGPVIESSGSSIVATPEVHAEIAAFLEYLEPRAELFGIVFSIGTEDASPALEQILGMDAAPRWMRECARARLLGFRESPNSGFRSK